MPFGDNGKKYNARAYIGDPTCLSNVRKTTRRNQTQTDLQERARNDIFSNPTFASFRLATVSSVCCPSAMNAQSTHA